MRTSESFLLGRGVVSAIHPDSGVYAIQPRHFKNCAGAGVLEGDCVIMERLTHGSPGLVPGADKGAILAFPQKDAGRRNECYDGLLFPPEQGSTCQSS